MAEVAKGWIANIESVWHHYADNSKQEIDVANRKKSASDKPVDVLIAGGGYVGLSTAVAIKDAAPHLSVTLVDAAPEKAISTDERASAIAAAASRMAEQA